MNWSFINDGIFEPHKSSVDKIESTIYNIDKINLKNSYKKDIILQILPSTFLSYRYKYDLLTLRSCCH